MRPEGHRRRNRTRQRGDRLPGHRPQGHGGTGRELHLRRREPQHHGGQADRVLGKRRRIRSSDEGERHDRPARFPHPHHRGLPDGRRVQGRGGGGRAAPARCHGRGRERGEQAQRIAEGAAGGDQGALGEGGGGRPHRETVQTRVRLREPRAAVRHSGEWAGGPHVDPVLRKGSGRRDARSIHAALRWGLHRPGLQAGESHGHDRHVLRDAEGGRGDEL
mmetsp:Transcript_41567/g.87226  ORF Transcript_41567/g.87226 Transcript_41567/m.87226 type:complete len:219 (-) Transcript_41567:412-1068(-)